MKRSPSCAGRQLRTAKGARIHRTMWAAMWARPHPTPRKRATPNLGIALLLNLVAETGVEPVRLLGQRILNPPRLPFRHSAVGARA